MRCNAPISRVARVSVAVRIFEHGCPVASHLRPILMRNGADTSENVAKRRSYQRECAAKPYIDASSARNAREQRVSIFHGGKEMKRRKFIAQTVVYGLGQSLSACSFDMSHRAESHEAPPGASDRASYVASGADKSPPSNIALLGQVVIRKAVDFSIWPGHEALKNRLAKADGVFANLESLINAPRAGTLTRAQLTLHAADPSALATLAYLRINLLGTANNHAFDLHTDGILNTMDALSAAAIPFAGTGKNRTVAAAPAYGTTGDTTTAVIAFATGMLRPGAAAGDAAIGVNELRRQANGEAEPEDVARILGAIREARARADVVIACHHNHDSEPGSGAVPRWQRTLAYQCVDEGATVFASHGVPVLQGVEIYRKAPLFFGLGNFMFQVAKPVGAYEEGAWDGVIALCAFENRQCRQVRLLPIVLNETAADGSVEGSQRGLPTLATPSQARSILAHLRERSSAYGTNITMLNGEGVIMLS